MASLLEAADPVSRTLLACIRPAAQEELATLVARVTADQSWDTFLQRVGAERAAPLVARALVALPSRAVPDIVLARLRRAVLASAIRQQRLQLRLFDALALLEERGWPVVLLKGAALAHLVYPSFVARPMADVDLLLDAADAPAAHALLCEHGWSVAQDIERAAEFYAEHAHLEPLLDEGGLGLELHTNLFPAGHPFRLDGAAVLRDARAVEVDAPRGGRRPIRVPSVPHLFVHASVHLVWSHVMRSGLVRWITDLSALTTDAAFDWAVAVAAAKEARAGTCAYWALRVARELGGVSVPPWVEIALQPASPEWLRAALGRHFTRLLLRQEPACPSARMEQWLWRAAVQPGREGHANRLPWSRDTLYLAAGLLPAAAGAPSPPVAERGARNGARNGARGRAEHVGAMARYLWGTLMPRG